MKITFLAAIAALGALLCIPAQAALPSITKPSVKVVKPAITKGEDGSVTITKGDVKVEKPELKLPEAPEKPELKKPTIEKPSVDIEKPSITTDGDTIKINKGDIKVNKGSIKLQ